MQTTRTPAHRFASVAAAAEHLDINPRTVRRRIADGTVTGYRIGRLVKVDLNEVEAKMLRTIPALGGDVA